jgi:nucleotide-binding universal stress UspA family protein
MLRTLVVPLDGSELAERALPYAVRLTESHRGRLVLMRAVVAPPSMRLDGEDWERLQLEAVEEASDYLRGLAQTIQRVRVETVVRYGRTVESILDTVGDHAADAVVMATHGRTGLCHLLSGSVTEAVLAGSTVPVFVVRALPGESPQASFEPAAARLLVPLDGSDFDEPALRTAIQALGAWGEITLVQVVQPPDHVERGDNGRPIAFLDQQEEARTRAAREYLNAIARDLRHQVPPIRVRVDVRVGEPVDGIAMAAAAAASDVIVMATHARTGLRRAVIGSIAGAVLRRSSTPVLLVHPQAPSHARTGPAEAALAR